MYLYSMSSSRKEGDMEENEMDVSTEQPEESEASPEPVIVRPISKLKYRGLVKEEKLFQPSSGFGTERKWPEMITFETDPIILNTVHLVDYKRKLERIVAEKRSQIRKKKTNRIVYPFAKLPSMPEVSEQILKRMDSEDLVKLGIQRPLAAPYYSENDNQTGMESNFVRGIGSSPPPISESVTHEILKKVVTALSGHAGFRGIKESALLTFADVAGYYMSLFCKVLRMNVDRSEGLKAIGYIDALEQTFQDVEGSSMIDLVDFYQEKIIKYHSRMMLECKRLIETNEQLERIAKIKLDEQSKQKEKLNFAESSGVSRVKKCDVRLPRDNGEQSGASDGLGTAGLDSTKETAAKEKKRKNRKKLPQEIEEKRVVDIGDDDCFEDFYSSELFPDQLSLSTDEDSSYEAREIKNKKKRKCKRAKSKPDAPNSAASKNVNSTEASASAPGKGKKITSGSKEPKKRVSQKTLKKVTFDMQLEKEKEESGKEEESPLKKSPVVRRQKGASLRLKDSPEPSSQDETSGDRQAPSSAIEIPTCVETIPQAPKEMQNIQLLKRNINEDQKEETVSISLPTPVDPVGDISTQFVAGELAQDYTKIQAIPGTSKIDKGKKRRAPPKVKEPETPALGVMQGELFPFYQDLHGLPPQQQQLCPTFEMKEQRKKQPSRRKILPTATYVPSIGGTEIPQMVYQPQEIAMDLSPMHNMMEVPFPLSPIGDTETGKKKRKYKKRT